MYTFIANIGTKTYTYPIFRCLILCFLILTCSCTEFSSKKNQGSRIERISVLAEEGSATAQTALGQLYEQGIDFAPDPEMAMYWYRRSAAKGEALAEFHIGSLYERGAGVERDYVEAAKWYKRASDKDNESAQAALAFLYDRGLGVTRNFSEARALYKLASKSWARAETFPLEYTYATGRNEVDAAGPAITVAESKLQVTEDVSSGKYKPAIEIDMAALDFHTNVSKLKKNKGTYFLNLSTYKNETEALLTWEEITSIDANLFEKLLVKIQPVTIEGEEFGSHVKLIVGPIESGIQSLKLCDILRSQGYMCQTMDK